MMPRTCFHSVKMVDNTAQERRLLTDFYCNEDDHDLF